MNKSQPRDRLSDVATGNRAYSEFSGQAVSVALSEASVDRETIDQLIRQRIDAVEVDFCCQCLNYVNLASEFTAFERVVVTRVMRTQIAIVAATESQQGLSVGVQRKMDNSLSAAILGSTQQQFCQDTTMVRDRDNWCREFDDQPIGSYFTTPVLVNGVFYGNLCLLSEQPQAEPLTAENQQRLATLAAGIGKLIELQLLVATELLPKTLDSDLPGSGYVDFLHSANLPRQQGIAARVIAVLQARIGKAPLSIGDVADELNLSKRTLQRRLQSQQLSFAELRDQIRYHYSISYLLSQRLGIDAISVALDFSDRTSFTNAFKRWTGLSPSLFRKVFRDFV